MRYKGFIILLLFLAVIWHKPILKIYFTLNYKDQIINCSKDNGVGSATISAIVFAESRFNAAAKSRKGALGLMQIMPDTGKWVAEQLAWQEFSVNDLLKPETNLTVGTWYLAHLKRNFDNEYLALASYNAGTRYVLEWLADGTWDGDKIKIEQIPFPETKKYLIQILVLRKIYNYLYPELVI